MVNFQVSLNNHINTRHAVIYQKTNVQELYLCSEGIYDLFQREVLDSEEVFACNICNEEFDTDDEVKNHIEINHKDIVIKSTKT